ncbi:MAG: magnesium transporter [Verrucomicrobia bacterium]|nr:MAG: magnesium transporter [Verrucomicrobiota bacterium]
MEPIIPEKHTAEAYSIEELQSMDWMAIQEIDVGRLRATPAVDIAHLIEHFDTDEQRHILRLISEELAADVVSELRPEESAELLGEMGQERAVQIVGHFDPDDATDIIAELDEDDRSRILSDLTPEQVETVTQLLSYPEDSAGGIMTTEFASVSPEMHVDEAIARVRTKSREVETIYYIYVLDGDNRLVGVASMRDLILARSGNLIADVMEPELFGIVSPETDREEVAHLVAEYNLLAVPVVDGAGRILGIVTHDDVLDILQEEATEDIQKLVGAGGDENVHSKIRYSLKKRGPWLLVNLGTASLASAVVYLFRHQIEQLSLLAVFMPIIASLGGNSGAQTLAVAIRSLAMGEVAPGDRSRICLREASLGILHGIGIGLTAAIAAYLMIGDIRIGMVVFVAMILNMTLAGTAGALIPLTLERVGLDPAQSSSIFLTSVTDVAGFFIFLSLGTAFLIG